jgi:ABC-2 type transport system ATP-binding protein
MIKVKQISKRFNHEYVLEGIEFEVKRGEIVGLVGPNGAGKTTLLNIIAGIWPASEGAVEIDGCNISNAESIRRILGYIPDTPFLYPKLTGREFLLFVGALYKLSPEDLKTKIPELGKALEISFWLDELMEGFPRGVRQKMVLAAMLLHSPRILLLDEPTANLDPKSARLVKDLLQNLARQGASILLSTHILEIAERLCQRLIILDKGRIVAAGTIQDLRNAAKSPQYNLEQVFLRLTGGESYAELLKYLS